MFRPLPKYRISHAALGKRLATIIEMEKQAMMNPEQFHDTIFAVYNLILDPAYEPHRGSNHHPAIYEEQKLEVEKSARRSAAAREAARRRKEMKAAAANSLGCNRPVSVPPPVGNTTVDDEEIARQVRRCVNRQLRSHGW